MVSLHHPLVLLVAVPTWLAILRWGMPLAPRRPLRLVWAGLLALMAAGPAARAPDVGTTVVLVVDRSASVSAGLIKQRENEPERRTCWRLSGLEAKRASSGFRCPGDLRKPTAAARTRATCTQPWLAQWT